MAALKKIETPTKTRGIHPKDNHISVDLSRKVGNANMNIFTDFLGFCDRASWANCEVREKTNKMQQLDVYFQQYLNMFRVSLCPSLGEQERNTPHAVTYVLFSWRWA